MRQKQHWSKTAFATILLGFLFVGGASLQAQEGSENGWFVSASPLIFGASKIETKTTITASGGGEATVGDFTAVIHTNVNNTYDSNVQNIASNLCAGDFTGYNLSGLDIFYLAEDISDATDLTLGLGETLAAVRFRLNGEELPFTGNPNDVSKPNVNLSLIADSACKDEFDKLLLQDLSSTSSNGSSETSVGKALAGNGFQVGYRDGDYRYSLTNYSWAAETDKLDLQLAMIEYYLAKGLLLGLGTANVKLDSSAGSQSQRATAYSVSYQYPLFKNFFVEANYTLLQTNLSLQKETIITEAAIDQTDTRVIGFYLKNSFSSVGRIPALYYENDSGNLVDLRTTVTRTQSRSASPIHTNSKKYRSGSEKSLCLPFCVAL